MFASNSSSPPAFMHSPGSKGVWRLAPTEVIKVQLISTSDTASVSNRSEMEKIKDGGSPCVLLPQRLYIAARSMLLARVRLERKKELIAVHYCLETGNWKLGETLVAIQRSSRLFRIVNHTQSGVSSLSSRPYRCISFSWSDHLDCKWRFTEVCAVAQSYFPKKLVIL